MKHETAATDLNLSKGIDDQDLIFDKLETFLVYLQGQLKAPLHYYEIIIQGIEAFPRLETVDRIDLLKNLLFLTKQFYAISIHNLQDLLLGQLEKEETILANENKAECTGEGEEENGDFCSLSNSKPIVFYSTATELGHVIGAAASTSRDKNGNLMFLSEREEIAEIASKIFVDIHGVKVKYNSILRYIKEGWVYMQNPIK